MVILELGLNLETVIFNCFNLEVRKQVKIGKMSDHKLNIWYNSGNELRLSEFGQGNRCQFARQLIQVVRDSHTAVRAGGAKVGGYIAGNLSLLHQRLGLGDFSVSPRSHWEFQELRRSTKGSSKPVAFLLWYQIGNRLSSTMKTLSMVLLQLCWTVSRMSG